jgi:hypothetical protein
LRDGNFQDRLRVSVIHIYSFGVILLPIENESGLSRARSVQEHTVGIRAGKGLAV